MSTATKLDQFIGQLLVFVLPAVLLLAALVGFIFLGWDWRLLFVFLLPPMTYFAGGLVLNSIRVGIAAVREERFVRRASKRLREQA